MCSQYVGGRWTSPRSKTTSRSPKDAYGMPIPTPFFRDPTKKSHARKQPKNHIPRARNPFMLFRCNFVDQKLVPASEETDHRNISRIAGQIWQEMTENEKRPWVEMAELDKLEHFKQHGPLSSGPPSRSDLSVRRKPKRGDNFPRPKQDNDEMIASDEFFRPVLGRSESAPPGPLHVSQSNLEAMELDFEEQPWRSRDDLFRRPSRVALYQSSSGLSYDSDHETVLYIPPTSLQNDLFDMSRCDSDDPTTRNSPRKWTRNQDDHAFYCDPTTDHNDDESVGRALYLSPAVKTILLPKNDEFNTPISTEVPNFKNPFMGEVEAEYSHIEAASLSPCSLPPATLDDVKNFSSHIDPNQARGVSLEGLLDRRTSSDLICDALSNLSIPSDPLSLSLMDVEVVDSRSRSIPLVN